MQFPCHGSWRPLVIGPIQNRIVRPCMRCKFSRRVDLKGGKFRWRRVHIFLHFERQLPCTRALSRRRIHSLNIDRRAGNYMGLPHVPIESNRTIVFPCAVLTTCAGKYGSARATDGRKFEDMGSEGAGLQIRLIGQNHGAEPWDRTMGQVWIRLDAA